MNQSPLIGIMSAMPEEGRAIVDAMTEKTTISVGKHIFIKGLFEGKPVVFSLSGIGKVSAATTAALMIGKFQVQEIIFTGVAGGGKDVQIGDIVIGSSYLQHDLDLRPIMPQFYIYSLEKQVLEANVELVARAKEAILQFFSKGISFPSLGIFSPQVHEGVIVSGDQFIGKKEDHEAILQRTQEILSNSFHAVEMEGAAVAQVCTELQVPFVVLRAISDKADQTASVNFTDFIEEVASYYSLEILREFFRILNKNDR